MTDRDPGLLGVDLQNPIPSSPHLSTRQFAFSQTSGDRERCKAGLRRLKRRYGTRLSGFDPEQIRNAYALLAFAQSRLKRAQIICDTSAYVRRQRRAKFNDKGLVDLNSTFQPELIVFPDAVRDMISHRFGEIEPKVPQFCQSAPWRDEGGKSNATGEEPVKQRFIAVAGRSRVIVVKPSLGV